MDLFTVQRVMKDVLPVVDENAGRNREMKEASSVLSSAAAVIGDVARGTAQKVGMRFALDVRVRQQKEHPSTPFRSPLALVTNLQTEKSSTKAHSGRLKRKANVLDTGTPSGEARDLRPRFLGAEFRLPPADDGKMYTAKTALRILWQAKLSGRKPLAVIQEMVELNLVPVHQSRVYDRWRHPL